VGAVWSGQLSDRLPKELMIVSACAGAGVYRYVLLVNEKSLWLWCR